MSISYVLLEDVEIALDYEQTVLDYAQGTEILCNIATNARASATGLHLGHTFNLGRTHTEETKAKMSQIRTGRQFTDEHRQALSAAHMNKNGIPVYVEGVRYETAVAAARAHNVTYQTVLNRIENPKERYAGWSYAT